MEEAAKNKADKKLRLERVTKISHLVIKNNFIINFNAIPLILIDERLSIPRAIISRAESPRALRERALCTHYDFNNNIFNTHDLHHLEFIGYSKQNSRHISIWTSVPPPSSKQTEMVQHVAISYLRCFSIQSLVLAW